MSAAIMPRNKANHVFRNLSISGSIHMMKPKQVNDATAQNKRGEDGPVKSKSHAAMWFCTIHKTMACWRVGPMKSSGDINRRILAGLLRLRRLLAIRACH